MEKEVLLTISSLQQQLDEAPETTRLVTKGHLSVCREGICLSYAETELTGLEGTVTEFLVCEDKVVLKRSGTLNSRMTFIVGQEDRSLYDMGIGALMISVRAEHICSQLNENGGSLTVAYSICIEDEPAGKVTYEIEVQPLQT